MIYNKEINRIKVKLLKLHKNSYFIKHCKNIYNKKIFIVIIKLEKQEMILKI